MTKLNLIKGAKNLDHHIGVIKRAGKKFDDAVQRVALSIAHHVHEHGDATKATMLVEALNKGARTNALKAWFEAHAKVRWDEKAKVFKFKKNGNTKLELGAENPWYNFKPEPPYRPLDLLAEIDKLIERATKQAQNANELDDIPMDKLAELVAMRAKMGGQATDTVQ